MSEVRQYNPEDLYNQLRQIIDMPKDGVVSMNLFLCSNKPPVLTLVMETGVIEDDCLETITKKFKVVPLDECMKNGME